MKNITHNATAMIVGFLLGLAMLTGAQRALALSTYSIASITNDTRASNGVGTLSYNGQLAQAAQMRAQDILDYDYWSHTSPTGKTMSYFLSAVGYPVYSAGENLSRGWDTDSSVVNAWMASPSHRTAMLNSTYTDIGVGYASGMLADEYTTIVVAYYASTGPVVAPAPQPAPAPEPIVRQTPQSQPTTQTTAPEPVVSEEVVPSPAPVPQPVTPIEPSSKSSTPLPVEVGVVEATQSTVSTTQNTPTTEHSAWGVLSTLFSYVELLFIERHVSFVLS